jgi:hypothetical protein
MKGAMEPPNPQTSPWTFFRTGDKGIPASERTRRAHTFRKTGAFRSQFRAD